MSDIVQELRHWAEHGDTNQRVMTPDVMRRAAEEIQKLRDTLAKSEAAHKITEGERADTARAFDNLLKDNAHLAAQRDKLTEACREALAAMDLVAGGYEGRLQPGGIRHVLRQALAGVEHWESCITCGRPVTLAPDDEPDGMALCDECAKREDERNGA